MSRIVRLTETDLNRIVKRVISEENENNKYEPITLDLIKEYIKENLEGYDLSDIRVRRRLNNEMDELAKDYYDKFISRLVYISEDSEWKDFLEKIEY